MKKILSVLIFALFASVAHAGFTFSESGVTVVGYDESCTANIPTNVLFAAAAQGVPVKELQRADVASSEGSVAACWLPTEPGHVFIMDENGAFGSLKIGEPT